MIPGANILNMALSVIARQTISYYMSTGRVLNDVGQYVTSYSAGVFIVGSFQPVPKELYTKWGLDLQKTYYVFYTSNNLVDIGRDVSGDQIAFNGQRFQCESADNWYEMDGWKRMLCVLIQDQGENPQIIGFNENPQLNDNQNFDNGAFSNDG